MQGPYYIWVNYSAVCGNLLKKIFPTVKIVLEDSTHLMRRYMRTLTPGHPLNRESQLLTDAINLIRNMHAVHNFTLILSLCISEDFMAALSMAFFTLHAPDVAEHKDALLRGGKCQEEVDSLPVSYFKDRCAQSMSPALATVCMHSLSHLRDNRNDLRLVVLFWSRCRRTIPPPAQLEHELKKVMDRVWVDHAGVSLLTDKTLDVHDSALKLVRRGAVSGELCSLKNLFG